MVWLILLLVAVGLLIWAKKCCAKSRSSDTEDVVFASWTLFVIVSIINVFGYSWRWSYMVDLQEKVVLTYQQEQISHNQATAMLDQFREALAKQYPDIEKEIFSKIGPQPNMTAYLAQYPQLHSNETITKLVDETNRLWSKYYEVQYERAKIQYDMRVLRRSIAFFNFLLPDTPPEVEKLLAAPDPTPPSK